jgi:hypothetical protein
MAKTSFQVKTFSGTVRGAQGAIFEVEAPPTAEILNIEFASPTITFHMLVASSDATAKRKFFVVPANTDIPVVNRPFVYVGNCIEPRLGLRYVFEQQPTEKVHQFRRLF